MHDHTLHCLSHVQSIDTCSLSTHSSVVLCICMQVKPINRQCATYMGWDNIDGGVTVYMLVGPGFEYRWGQDFPHLSRLALGPTKLPKSQVLAVFPRSKWAGHGVDPLPLLAPTLKKV